MFAALELVGVCLAVPLLKSALTTESTGGLRRTVSLAGRTVVAASLSGIESAAMPIALHVVKQASDVLRLVDQATPVRTPRAEVRMVRHRECRQRSRFASSSFSHSCIRRATSAS